MRLQYDAGRRKIASIVGDPEKANKMHVSGDGDGQVADVICK